MFVLLNDNLKQNQGYFVLNCGLNLPILLQNVPIKNSLILHRHVLL